jgi:hypothetical protein
LPEAVWFDLCCQCNLLQLGVVALLDLGWRHIADRLEEATIVEPVDPFEGSELDCLQRAPWPAPADQLSLEQAMDGFGECIVVAVANAADGWFDADRGEALDEMLKTVYVGVATNG